MSTIRVSKSPGSPIWKLGDPVTQEIPVPLPPEKVAELARESATATVRISELEAELKAFKDKIKAEQTPLEEKVSYLAPIILNGTAMAPTDCQWETDEHTTKVWLRRLDTNEVIKGSERAPTGDELAALRQGVIPMDVPADGGPKRGRKNTSGGTTDAARDAADQLFAKPAAGASSAGGELPAFQPDGESGAPVRPRLALVSEQGSGVDASKAIAPGAAQQGGMRVHHEDPAAEPVTFAERPSGAEVGAEHQGAESSEIPPEPAPLSSYTLPAPHQDWQLQRFPENMVHFSNGPTFVGVAEWSPGAGHWTNIEETEGETIPAQVLQAGIVAMLEQKLPEQPEQLPPASEWLTFGDWRVCATGDVLRFWTGTTDVATAGANPEGTALTFFRGPTIEIPEQVIRFTMDAVRKGVLKFSKPDAAASTRELPDHVPDDAQADAGGEEDEHAENDAQADESSEEPATDEEQADDAGPESQEHGAKPAAGASSAEEGGDEAQDTDSLSEFAAAALRQTKVAGAAGLSAKEIGSKTHNRRPGRTLGILVERGYLQVVGDGAAARYTITDAGGQRLEAYDLAHQPKRGKK